MNRLFPHLFCLLVCPACLAAAGLPPSGEERLRQLEARLARLETQLAAAAAGTEVQAVVRDFRSLQRELGWDGKSPLTVARAAGRERKLSLGGFVHTHAEFGGAPDSRYTGINNRVVLRRARITTKGSFAEGFEFVLQPDFGNNSIAGNSGYRGGFADAYVAWNKHEAATVQLGQFKSAFGYEQLLSDTRTPMVERSLPNDLLTFSRQIGAAVLGSILNRRISYNVGAYNGNGVNNGNNDNDQFMYAGRISACVWSSGANRLTVATNGLSTRESGAFSGRRTSWGLDGQLAVGRFEGQAEYLHSLQNRDVGADVTMAGWSLLAGYFVVPKTWQALVRYETYDANTRIPATTSATWVIGANYFLQGDDIKFAFNYYLGDPAGAAPRAGRFMSRVQVVF
jgi:phosphate-selective porin